MRAPAVRAALALGALCLVLTAACSDSAGTLDQAATEHAVGEAVAAKVGPQVTATRCPGDLERTKGGTFTCQVALKRLGDLPVAVRQIDDEGTLQVTPAAAVVTTDRITKELTAALKKQFGRTFTVRCSGDPTEVRAPGSTSTCGASDGTSRREVTVTVSDSAGTLAFAVAPAT